MPKGLLKKDKVHLLSNLPLFETLTQKELAQVAALTVEAHRPAGTVLTREGQLGGVLFVIVDGYADLLRNKRKVLQLGPGDVVGELSLIDGQARSADAVAATDVHLLQLTHEDFNALLNKSPTFVRNLLRALSMRIREMDALAG
jgi:CRP-like cAMP-binding protein